MLFSRVFYAFFHGLLAVFFIAGCLAFVPTTTAESAPVADRGDTMQTNPLVRQAISDLARRESIPSGSIELVSYEEVVWPDASLGCPHPDMSYIQVPQDGARIVLRFDNRERIYHSGGGRPPFLCANKAGR